MATADVPRSKKKQSSKAAVPRRSVWRRFRRGCYLLLFLLLVAVALLPTIVAKTPLRDIALRSALSTDATITMNSLSLGWFSAAAVEGLEIRDARGEPLLEVEAIRCDKPLVGMLLDLADLGAVHVTRPVVHLVLGETDSNWEQAFARELGGASGPSSGAPRAISGRLEVEEATVLVDDQAADRKFEIRDLVIEAATTGATGESSLAAHGAVLGGRKSAQFEINVKLQGIEHGTVDCQTAGLPLELFEPIARRQLAGGRLAGRLTARLGGAWGQLAVSSDASLAGEATISNLQVAAAALGNETIALEQINLPCQIRLADDMVEIEKLGLECELGEVSLSGTVALADLKEASVTALARQNFELAGRIDLARLAAMLPDTLQLRSGVEITAGQIECELAGRKQRRSMSWSGRIETEQLAGRAEGRDVRWEHPLSVRFKAAETADGIEIERAECTSSFLQANASGTLVDLTAEANFDLARLAEELRQFSDLKQLQISGKGAAQLVWKQEEEDRFGLQADFQARGFQWITPRGLPWREDTLAARLDMHGDCGQRDLAVRSAQLTVDAAGEQLILQLQEKVSDPWEAAWPLKCSGSAQLARWTPRLAVCLGLEDWNLAGAAELAADLKASRHAIEIESSSLELSQLRVIGHGWFINEPRAVLELTGRCDLERGRVDITQTQLAAGDVTIGGSSIQLLSGSDGLSVADGHLKAEADLAQLDRWRHDPRTADGLEVSGRLTAEADVKHQRGEILADCQGQIDNLRFAERARRNREDDPGVWQERRVTLALRGTYRPDTQELKLATLQVGSGALRCQATGALTLVTPGGGVDLQGQIEYDWDQLEPLLRSFAGQGVRVAGRQARAFSLRGPLDGPLTDGQSWRRVVGEGAVGWEAMNVHGLDVGAGEIAAQLAEGSLRIKPIDVEVSSGRLTLAPWMRLNPPPAEVFVGRGPLLTNVHLSPELCAQGLKFMAPILADAAVAEGRFSVELDGGRLPIADAAMGDVAGRLAVRGQIKPGPVAREFLAIIQELATVLRSGNLASLGEQSGSLIAVDSPNVEFRLTGGRMYHRNLQLMIGTLPIRTYGSVGLVDETLALVAEIPLEAKLLGIDFSFGALEGQTIKIPIEGTLGKPKLDHREVQNLAGQILQNTARGVLFDEVNRQVEKLFPIR